MKFGGWGRFPIHESERLIPARSDEILRFQGEGDGLVPRGNGRAYGDAAIGTRQTMAMRAFDRMRSFDPDAGFLIVEAGTLLSDINAGKATISRFCMLVVAITVTRAVPS